MDNGDFQTETQRNEFESNVHDIASLTESDTETAEAACDKNDSDSSRKEKSNVDKPETHSKKRKFPRELREFLIRITATVIVLWFTLTFLIGVYICHSNTCYPMVKDGDLCVTWRPETPSQGDLIVYMHNGEPCFGRVAAIPGDKVTISGPFGEFLLPENDPKDMEYIFVGGGAGMAPLRSHIMHLFKTLKTDRTVHFFYGARSLVEAFYLEDFAEIEKEFPNFKFHLALDRPDPAADAAGVAYTPGFVHNVMYETYLKNHETPEDIKYFMCGPPMMVGAVNGLLDSLGVPPESILYDNFG